MKSQAPARSVEELVSRCHALEKKARVTLDDVLNKATQEVAEMLEAHVSGNAEETRKEAGDALLNVLSASAWALGSADFGFAFVSSGEQSAAGRGERTGLAPVWGEVAAASPVRRAPEDKGNSRMAGRGGPLGGVHERRTESEVPSPASLFLKLGVWNSKIQSLRGKYSRSKASVEEVRSATADLVSAVLSFVPEADPASMLADTVAKFESRVDAYLPKLDLRDFVNAHADFPKPGILFRDVSPMLASPEAMKTAAHEIALRCEGADVVVGLDARGFLFGLAAAEVLGKPFVMVRKKGKLPGETISKAYALEYWKEVIEIQKRADIFGKKVAIVDDLLATGGTALAAAELVEKAGGIVESVVCAISLDDLAHLPGREELQSKYRVDCVLRYE